MHMICTQSLKRLGTIFSSLNISLLFFFFFSPPHVTWLAPKIGDNVPFKTLHVFVSGRQEEAGLLCFSRGVSPSCT